MFFQRLFYDYSLLSQQVFVCRCSQLSLRLETGCTDFLHELYLPKIMLLLLHREGEDAHTVTADGAGEVFGGSAMTRRKRLR